MQEALKLFKPTAEERKKISGIISEFSKSVKIKDAKAEVGGSIAKDTWLKGEHDLDIYIKFDQKKYANKDISAILKKSLEKKYKIEDVHGSRTYYRIYEDKYVLEVIPILNIKKASQAANITDVSPFHVKWVKKNKKLTDDIRLAKALCKANNLYGAESYIKGFSGYALEILVAHYGSFNKLMKAAAKWAATTVLDPEKHHRNKNIRFMLNKSKLESPLVLIDPVQADRNAAAGLGNEKYLKLIQLAKEYNKKPSTKFFEKKTFNADDLRKKFIVVEAEGTEGRRDVVGAKLLKAFEFLTQELERNDFTIKKSDWHWAPGHKALMWFALDKEELELWKKHLGPPLKLKNRVEDFKNKWKGLELKNEGDRCYVMIKREHTNARDLLKETLKNAYLKDKAERLRLL